MHLPDPIPIQDAELSAALSAAIDGKTKPRGSLGQLERLAHRLGMIQRTLTPRIDAPAIVVFAADHGVVAEGVSAYPQDVTWQMVENFLRGGAAINVLARQHGVELLIVDAGVNHRFGERPGLVDRKIGPGTRNFAHEPAMTLEECMLAMQYGAGVVEDLTGGVVGFGEMGIGNTTSASALMHKLSGLGIEDCVGAGTGLDDAGISRKARVIRDAARKHPGAMPVMEVLATFGGYEIAMMAGAMLRAAERRMAVLVDGFIATAALLAAARMRPSVLDYCIFSHCSDEHGHRRLLRFLGGRPLLHLGMRLGEGTGCAMAVPILRSAVAILNEMATFDSARISEMDAAQNGIIA
ncbi:nicotinate-nucleotide--dimethylbenzimidazole phosphoribosyltransferase [Alcaligenaceae bacterium]|nr:nicotinate-nucleotide--dimethylbenzimidazole phosphoribosyltransferase [Alcaligenaceae bacterium]